ncbi:Uncharacterized membrane protein YckC, RDD family [Pedococcus dokdonensis]|uniref:Uncharacterized membrane protein YckC, RDD family n=1 Tax=Pedococcus dokdonensis TaxID=443156 RepID=A0A1H0SST6_9MICO|nr:RDD family protein [Pedococcus dokdonensis]SDP44754.1 Uncharacterized membrane protein YckC, RDD family [Pedococcus dokdonensis]
MTQAPPPVPSGADPAAGWAAPGGYAGPPAQSRFDGPWGPLAPWGTRVLAMLIDSLVSLIGLVPYIGGIILFVVGAPDSRYDDDYSAFEYAPAPDPGSPGLMVAGVVLVVLGLLAMLAIQLWNRCFKMGRTGQSIGKKAMGIRLVDEHSGRPIGAGMAFVRDLAHYLDGAAYIGYLWPLWDDKRQTFADKILNTVVVEVPKTP